MKLDDLLARLNGVKKTGAGYVALCPAHEDHSPSLSISVGDDSRLLLKCHAGCEVSAICAAMGIEVKELFADKPPKRAAREPKPVRPITVAELAAAKCLPIEFLVDLGVEDAPDGSGVVIGYFDANGNTHSRLRKRTALRAKDGSFWLGPGGVSPIPYGLWKLAEWRR